MDSARSPLSTDRRRASPLVDVAPALVGTCGHDPADASGDRFVGSGLRPGGGRPPSGRDVHSPLRVGPPWRIRHGMDAVSRARGRVPLQGQLAPLPLRTDGHFGISRCSQTCSWSSGRCSLWSRPSPDPTRIRAQSDSLVPPLSTSVSAPSRPGDRWGRIAIPRVGLDFIVFEGALGDDPPQGPRSRSRPTATPDGGNCVIVGHRDSFFRRLSAARTGDIVQVRRANDTSSYRLESRRIVRPEDVVGPASDAGSAPHPDHLLPVSLGRPGPLPTHLGRRSRRRNPTS